MRKTFPALPETFFHAPPCGSAAIGLRMNLKRGSRRQCPGPPEALSRNRCTRKDTSTMRAIDTLRTALKAIIEEEGLAWPVKTVIEPPRDPKHGDLSVNSAMLLAKEAKANPRELAQKFAQ